MRGLTSIFDGTAAPSQQAFNLYAVPGQTFLVFVGGLLIRDFSVEGSTLTLPSPLSGGQKVAVFSSSGGTVIPQSYLDSALSGKADKTVVLDDLALKLDKTGGAVGRLYLPGDPVDPLEPATKQFAENLPKGLSIEDVQSMLAPKADLAYVDARENEYVPKIEKGAPYGVATLDPSGRVPFNQLYAQFFAGVFKAGSDNEQLSTGASVGDFVIRTDDPRRVYVRADDEDETMASYEVIAHWDARNLVFSSSGLLSTNVRDAIEEILSSVEDYSADADGRIATLRTDLSSVRTDLDASVSSMNSHFSRTVDPSSTETTRNRHVSNSDAKGWQDHLSRTNNPHGVQHGQTGPVAASPFSTDVTRDKHLANNDLKNLYDHRDSRTGHPLATTTQDGFMRGADKAKLDGVAPSATNTTEPPAQGVLVGEMRAYSVASADPAGGYWLLAQGRTLGRAAYPELHALYAAQGYPHGAGDGVSTFNIPDMRGRTAIGAGQAQGTAFNIPRTLGERVGTEKHTLTADESGLPSHNHNYVAPEAPIDSRAVGSTLAVTGRTATTTGTASQSAQLAHENTQPSTVLAWIVRVKP